MCLFVSGSQGEPFSALSMISIDEHRDVAVGPGDTVVMSSRPIPGNERAVSRLIGNLFRRGCDVVHGGNARVHVSGHASQDELVEMIQRVRPRYFVPVHGEYRMLAQHARLAVQAGVPADHVFIIEDGDVLSLSGEGAGKAGNVPAGRVLLDRSGVRRDRGDRHARPPPSLVGRDRGARGRAGPAERTARVAAGDGDARLRGLAKNGRA